MNNLYIGDMWRRDIFYKSPEAKLRGTVAFLFGAVFIFGGCIYCIYCIYKIRFSDFGDFFHEERFKAVELYLEGTDGDVAGGGGVNCQGLAARTHGAFDYVDE